ncbi:hypothetical protein J7382_10535 [Shimia sp. R11_0]|uniref:DUF6525 family protein n=1 Tax=Shimia sp. R11_0 TaxID=2821096 RepID=UPI001ADA03A7|nr:DUF6525 family protein [Shimia sp. R11_0]MBO9477972.1 hypothetical protein [Shimia sp. R11_0]
MARNLNSSLRGRRRGNPMQTYDALPPELRQWLSTAALPWSPASARGIWRRAGGQKDPQAALARLDLVEQATLRKDRWSVGMDLPS